MRSVYQQWPTDRLARAAIQEENDYQPEAVILMLAELQRRGLGTEELAKFSASLPPPVIPIDGARGTAFMPAKLNRKQYAIRWLLWAVALLVSGLLLATLFAGSRSMTGVVWVWALSSAIYKIMGLDIPRLKSAGMSPWLLLLFLVPFVNLVLVVLLFVVPPKNVKESPVRLPSLP